MTGIGSGLASEVRVTLPAWVEEFIRPGHCCADAGEAMALAITLARENIRRGTGGPFGAVATDRNGVVLGAGMNAVTRLCNSTAHAETVAIQMAQRGLHAYTFRGHARAPVTLVTSCDPCAMCLGAILWSGAEHLVTGADRTDAEALGFDEGPVFPASYVHLERRGVVVRRGVMRAEAREVLEAYRAQGGPIY